MADASGSNTATGLTGAAGGDLSGAFPNPTVSKINGATPGAMATAAVGQIPGTGTNDSATAGNIGEFAFANLTSAGALALSSNSATTVVTLPLTAGDWDVWGVVVFKASTITVVTVADAGVSTSSGTQPGLASGAQGELGFGAGLTGIADTSVAAGPARISLSASGTAFLVGTLTFATSTAAAYGAIQARRCR